MPCFNHSRRDLRQHWRKQKEIIFTYHYQFDIGIVAKFGLETEWIATARWVEDGNILTSSGVSAGMDMTLALIAKILGQEAAENAALWAEYDWHRDSSWDPFAKRHDLV